MHTQCITRGMLISLQNKLLDNLKIGHTHHD